jgi:hypothetical protein
MQSQTKFKGGAFGLDILADVPAVLRGKTLTRFEATIDDLDNCRFDMSFADGSNTIFVETKNYALSSLSGITSSGTFFNQFSAYMGKIKNIDEMKYFFKSNTGVTEALAKAQFKELFTQKSSNVFDIIWSNQNLKNSLWNPVNLPGGFTKAVAKSEFDSWVLAGDNRLFSFVNIK